MRSDAVDPPWSKAAVGGEPLTTLAAAEGSTVSALDLIIHPAIYLTR